jgi:predicted nucleic acid-binding protein
MLVLDSNVWIYVATAEEFPVEIYSDHFGSVLYLFRDFYSANRKTAISTYVVKEIQEGFDRSQRVSAQDKNGILTKLSS